MAEKRSLPLRESPDSDRPDSQSFMEMHRQLAALELAHKERQAEEEGPRPAPKLLSPISFHQNRPPDHEHFKEIAEQIENSHVTEDKKSAGEAANNTILGFRENNIHLPYYKLKVNDEIIKGIPDDDKEKEKGKIAPCLADMPKEVIKEIFHELYPQWQVCFALSSRSVMKISKEINNGWGVVYGRAAKFHILWRLESWMTNSRKLCMACEVYFPVSTEFWMKRKKYGPCGTASRLYGRQYADFEFVEGICPECVAQKKWRELCTVSTNLQTSPFD